MGGAVRICGLDGGCGVRVSGCVLSGGLSDGWKEDGRGGMRQYVPPKCMVFRLRSVRHVQAGLLRKVRRSCSSERVMKAGMRDRPGMWSSWGVGGGGLMVLLWGDGGKKSVRSLRFLVSVGMSGAGEVVVCKVQDVGLEDSFEIQNRDWCLVL